MKRIDELFGMPIVTLDEGQRIGTLNGLGIDVEDARVAYLRFAGEGKRPDGAVPWSAVHAVGADAITVRSIGDALDGIPAAERDRVCDHLGDRPVVTESGSRLGHVTSYDVNESTGEIARLHVHSGGVLGLFGKDLDFPPTAIRAFGKDAIIVNDAVARVPQAA